MKVILHNRPDGITGSLYILRGHSSAYREIVKTIDLRIVLDKKYFLCYCKIFDLFTKRLKPYIMFLEKHLSRIFRKVVH